MTLLRHEEFSDGCEATCNGNFANRWSKSMIGYGNEHENFVFEIVYNYSRKDQGYEFGNEQKLVEISGPLEGDVEDFEYDLKVEQSKTGSPSISKIHLNCTDVKKSENFWKNLLNLPYEIDENSNTATINLPNITITFHQLDPSIPFNPKETSGRTAFSAPTKFVKQIRDVAVQASKNDNQQYLHTDWVQLDTPGKATVEVVILKSNDGHEVCVVGDEAFVELSAFDPQAWDEVERKIENGKF